MSSPAALKTVGIADTILNDKEFRKTIALLGVSEPKASVSGPVKRRKAKVAKAKGARRAKRGQTGAKILEILGDKKLTTGEINAKLDKKSSNLSAVLAGMKKAGKIKKTGETWHV